MSFPFRIPPPRLAPFPESRLWIVPKRWAGRPATSQPQRTAASGDSSVRAAAKRWRTLQHKSVKTRYAETRVVKRRKDVRVIQVNARCWGNDTRLTVALRYKRGMPRPGWPIAKEGKFPCNGQYHTVRISNAGHSHYYAQLSVGRKHTIEWWYQYYG